jgi:hypothetical protein
MKIVDLNRFCCRIAIISNLPFQGENQRGGFNGWKPHPSPLLKGEGEIFPPLSGEDTGGVSFIHSPSQGETQKGFPLWLQNTPPKIPICRDYKVF